MSGYSLVFLVTLSQADSHPYKDLNGLFPFGVWACAGECVAQGWLMTVMELCCCVGDQASLSFFVISV